MNRERIAGKWKQFSGALRERWGKLIADRRCVDEGRHDQSAGRAQELYGVNKEKSQRELREFLYRNRRWDIPSR
jgi:uncharacterized protein YjbJ (UPF0337 family)